MTDTSLPSDPKPADSSSLQNAVLFCQDSVVKLAAARKLLNPIALDPTMRHFADSIGQLQNAMLDVLSWASQIDARLAGTSEK